MFVPPTARATRLTLRELGTQGPTLEQIAGHLDLDYEEAARLVSAADSRLRRALGLDHPLVEVERGRVRADACAGILPLAPGLELEIVPKFLSTESWREDFFLIMLIGLRGAAFADQQIMAGLGGSNDLADLIAYTITREYDRCRRRRIRQYREEDFADFAIRGEFEAEDLVLVGVEGFEQSDFVLDERNEFNAVISFAARALQAEVRSTLLRQQLGRIVVELGEQDPPPAINRLDRLLPGRHKAWQQLYSLAFHVLLASRVTYQGRDTVAPGFIMHTWRNWESFLAEVLVRAVGPSRTRLKPRHTLGTRSGVPFYVYPDYSVRTKSTVGTVLVDAKYKGGQGAAATRVTEADVYEALAFMEASSSSRTVLLFPDDGQARLADQPGCVSAFEEVRISGREIVGARVKCTGIAACGLVSFVREFHRTFEDLLAP